MRMETEEHLLQMEVNCNKRVNEVCKIWRDRIIEGGSHAGKMVAAALTSTKRSKKITRSMQGMCGASAEKEHCA